MSILQVDILQFTFEPTVAAQCYDQWQHYAAIHNIQGGLKAMDVVAIERDAPVVTWLIEAKDFRIITNPPRPSNLTDLPKTVAAKVTDTITGLGDAAANAVDIIERDHAQDALAAPVRRIVLHLEPPIGQHSALFPTGFPISVLQKLKQLVKVIDPNPLVLSIASTPVASVPWTVA